MNDTFKEWLINKGFAANTANRYNRFIEKKLKPYLHACHPGTESFVHETLMQYIRQRKSEGAGARTVNTDLKQISHYLDFKGLPNVAGPIRVKGVQRGIPHGLFTEKQLDGIYNKFPESRNHWTHENTLKTYHLILGLRV